MSETPTQTPTEEGTDRRAPLEIWRVVQAFVHALFGVCGAPEELARRHTLTLKDHQLFLKWLRAGEALLRRMLFIEAALIASTLPGRRAQREEPGPIWQRAGSCCTRSGNVEGSAPRLIAHDPDHPEQWRVSFRAFNASPACSGGGSRRSLETEEELDNCVQLKSAGRSVPGSGGAVKFRSAWPLAERLEALLRVFNDPLPYAKRLAQRLRKTRELVKRFTESWREHRDLVGHALYNALVNPITCGAAVFSQNSS